MSEILRTAIEVCGLERTIILICLLVLFVMCVVLSICLILKWAINSFKEEK